MKKITYLSVALVITFALVLTACGGEDTTTTATESAATTSATNTTETTTAATTTETTTEPETTPDPTTTPTPDPTTTSEPEEMAITSSAFEEGGIIPRIYSCDGQDKSPELNWTGVPEGTQSFALILDDPDAPGGTFNHWVIFNIPANATGLEKSVPKTAQLANGALQGQNSFEGLGYGGPCPPLGPSHRYYFTLYALDTTLDLAGGSSKAQVLAAMEGHILAEAEIMGNYQS